MDSMQEIFKQCFRMSTASNYTQTK